MKKKIKISALIISICIAIISFLTYSYTVMAASSGNINTSNIKQNTISPLYDIEKGTFWTENYNVGDKINETNSGTGIFHKYGVCLGHIYRFLNKNLEEKEDGTIVSKDRGDYLLQMIIEVNPDKIEGDSIYGNVEGNDYVVIKNWNDGSPNYTTLHGSDLARIIARSVYYQYEKGGYTLYPTFNEENNIGGLVADWTVPTDSTGSTSYDQKDLESLWKKIPQHWTNGYNIKTKSDFSDDNAWKIYSAKATTFKDRLWTDYYTVEGNKYTWGTYNTSGAKTLTGWWKNDHVGAFAMRYAIKLALKPGDSNTNKGWGLKENQYYIAFNGETGGQKEGDPTLEGEEKLQEIVTDDSSYKNYYDQIKELIDNNNSWNSKTDPTLTTKNTKPVFQVTDNGTFIGPYVINIGKDGKDNGAALSCEISQITVIYDDGQEETVYEYNSGDKNKNKNNVYTKSGENVYKNVSSTDNITKSINGKNIYFKVNKEKSIKEVTVKAFGPEKYKAKILIGGYTYNNTNEQTQVTATFGNAKKVREEAELSLPKPGFTSSLEISKIDKETKQPLGGVKFILKYESGVKGEEDSEIAKHCNGKYIIPVVKSDGSATNNYEGRDYKDYFSEDITEAKKFTTSSKEGNNNGKVTISNIIRGTYRIYEVETKSPNYALSDQGNIVKINDAYYRDCGTVILNQAGKVENVEITNMETRGTLNIQKTDSIYDEIKLEGAKFKIQYVDNVIGETEYPSFAKYKNHWVSNENGTDSGNYNYLNVEAESILKAENKEDAGVFVTDKDGQIKIDVLPCGKYHVYEVETPKGYDITKQDGYQEENNWVDCGEVIVKDTHDDDGVSKYQTYTMKNKKVVGKLEGYVWLDRPTTNKLNELNEEEFDSLRSTSSDSLIDSGITVNLKKEDGKVIGSTVTDKNGYWSIDKGSNGEEFNYWDLVNAYVEFVYDNKKYVCVDTFAEGKDKITENSKAKEYILNDAELNDTNLTGATDSLPGLAVTKQNAVNKETTAKEINERRWDNYNLEKLGLTGYYNEENYTIENINLGLWEKKEPTHSITHSLQYSKIQMNGYTYTYDYTGEKGAITDSNRVPETLKQVGAKAYAGAIVYPSDIAYTAERKPNGMEMYVVYKIDVINPTTDKISNIYDETRLYLTSLTDTFDTRRYELNTQHSGDQSWKGSEYFDLWETTTEGTANYKISEDAKLASTNGADVIDGSLSNGVNAGPEKAESVYIQFKVQQSFLEDLLAGSITDELMSSAVTEAHSTGYHSYTRTDNVWNENESASYYKDSTNADQNIANQNANDRKQFLHRSINENKDSGAFCLVFRLGDQRTISGTVFEDSVTGESSEQNEGLGNGIIDQNEANRAQGVKVELIDAAKVSNNQEDTRADLYVRTPGSGRGYKVISGNDTVVTTGEDGRYEFVGVVPGVYAIRFTYSNGNTIMIDSQGNKVDITSNNYKSTIINTDKAKDYIKNANETSVENMIGYVNSYNNTSNKDAQKYAEWYKYLYAETPDISYNMATDNFEIRNNLGIYNYKENGEGTEVTNQDNSRLDKWPEVPSNTPYFSISIENVMENVGNTEDGHNPIFDKFNFGLIKVAETTIKTDKIISNVKLVNQLGTTLEQGDPSKTENYITALDNLTKGSKYVRVEMTKDEIYGSTIETTYEITINNDSVKDYIEEEGTPEYGYYFKYGQKTDKAHLKTTTVIEAIDLIDEDYRLSNGELTETVVHPGEAKGGARTDTDGKVKMSVVQNENQPNYLSFTNWSAIEAGGSSQIDYTVNGILQEDMDLSYDNSAKVISMKLDAGATLKTAYDWGDYSTTRLMVTPDTGENRNQTYYIISAIALVILSTGIIVIKKKILK